jgi:hypothetical protein
MPFEEIIAVYRENHRKAINTKCVDTIVKANGADRYHWALKG